MNLPNVSSNALAADARSLDALKLQAGSNAPGAIKEAAKQFESMFMRELIKSMRDATMKSGLTDSPGGDLGADLLDQQLATKMTGMPGGLSDLIAKQLSANMGLPADAAAVTGSSAVSAGQRSASLAAYAPKAKGPEQFVQRHGHVAERVAQQSGIPASYMLGQAGHETAWGKSEIRMANGAPSFNLFGMKAGKGWTGKVAEVSTTEYVNGVPQKSVARFRAYDSYEESFKDYARMINTSPRYAQAREQTGSAYAFASGLQKAGYATDPEYANKLSRAIQVTQQYQQPQTST